MATTSIPANCAAVTQALLSLSGQYSGPMFNRSARKRPIINLQSKTRGAWQNGLGVTLNAVTFERSMPPLTGDPWTTMAVSDGDTVNACRPPTDTVSFGQTSRSYAPRHYAINTEDFCIRDLQFGWQFGEWLGNVTTKFSEIAEWVWYRRYTTDYVTIADHNVVLNRSQDMVDGTSYSTTYLPTGAISQGALDNARMDLVREGGDKPSGLDEDTNEPVFTLIIGSEASKRIIFNNPDLRQDTRYAYMGKGEMSPLAPGMPTKRRNYGGFVHNIDPYPRRFTYSGSAYVEVAPFVASSTTKGNTWEQNPAYKNAPYEEAIIWHEDNYQSLAVNTVTNPASGWNFTPHNWMGQFEPRNILDRTCNPDGDILFFRALFADAAKPLNPKVGWSFLFANCGIDPDVNGCNES